ncbi:hypothetical protein PGTUg99_012813 [Puccinia graminis f. sp. tritici]|uniref:Uncharacterized protein n=1 Tax=Puccinia graminis f. sp. tritici TaxID=56615 RepID=A0A5B0RED0_PUCGR|nr:hypothetical protein PGTUg99_012813 [Puccinia graminis f. sp. tritici]
MGIYLTRPTLQPLREHRKRVGISRSAPPCRHWLAPKDFPAPARPHQIFSVGPQGRGPVCPQPYPSRLSKIPILHCLLTNKAWLST